MKRGKDAVVRANQHHRQAVLTPRQAEVLGLLERGLSNRRIAAELGISLDGAKWHVGEILGRLGFETRVEVARWTRARGNVSWPRERSRPGGSGAA